MKTTLAALSLLLTGFALGWVLKSPPLPTLVESSSPVSSILDTTGSKSIDSFSSSSKAVTALVDLYDEHRSMENQMQAYRQLSRLSPKELQTLAESLDTISDDPRSHQLHRALLNRWAEVDFEDLFAFGLQTKDSNLSRHAMLQAINVAAKRDHHRALALIDTIENAHLRREALSTVTLILSKNDPLATFAAIKKESLEDYYYLEVFRSWANKAPLEAVEHLATITSRENRRNAINGLAQTWASKDPQGAADWAIALSNRNERRQALQGIMRNVSDLTKGTQLLDKLALKGKDRQTAINALAGNAFQADIKSALAWTQTLSPTERSQVIANQLYHITQVDPERARQLYDARTDGQLRHGTNQLARALARKDLANAQDWADSLPPGNARREAIQGIVAELQRTDPQASAEYLERVGLSGRITYFAEEVVSAWFDRDPSAAKTWATSQTDLDVRKRLTYAMVSHWSREDPAGAAAFSAEIEAPAHRRSALQNVMSNWANLNSDEAIAYFNGLEAEDQPTVLQTMIGSVANSDIDSAVELVESHLSRSSDEASGNGNVAAARNLVDSWAEFDVSAAAIWSATLENPTVRVNAINEATQNWLSQDSIAASEWIGQLPSGAARDSAVGILIGHIKQGDPSAAFAWATTLENEDQRQREFSRVLKTWKMSDPNAAMGALQSAELSDEAYHSLAKQLEQ
jgi:hypothetical protein